MFSFTSALQPFFRFVLGVKYKIRWREINDPPLPPPSLNFNQYLRSLDLDDYKNDFLRRSKEAELPFLREAARLNGSSLTLDFGCGLGRLAAAYAASKDDSGHYIGWEPEERALAWLKRAYSDLGGFDFLGTPLSTEQNYVTHKGSGTAQIMSKSAAPEDSNLKSLLGGRMPDLITSHSVFTHMWPEDAAQTLKRLSSIGASKGIMVHTWLILDELAIDGVQEGKSDRTLPHEIRGIYTYSKKNPLVCTAYPVQLLKDVYASADLTIETIIHGEWSGSGRSNPYTYQDVVISRLK
jgi:SAM-dependent methyltransferase